MANPRITLLFFIAILNLAFDRGESIARATVSESKLPVLSPIGGLLQPGIRAAYWPSFTGYPAASIDTSYFSHIHYAFVLPSSTTYALNITSNDDRKLREFLGAMTNRNPPAKTMLSIGGGGDADLLNTFSQMASQESSRAIFINSTIEVARKYEFDGVDLDWEFPSNDTDMSDLGSLFMEWREALEYEANVTQKPRLLLTSAVYYASTILNGEPRSYPSQAISQYVDWINPMCYNYHGPWENFTGLHSALYDPNTNLSTDFGIGSWIQAGVPPPKIVLGLPAFGKNWTLQNPNMTTIGAPGIGGNDLLYSQIIDFNTKNNATVVFDDIRVSYYSYAGVSWVISLI